MQRKDHAQKRSDKRAKRALNQRAARKARNRATVGVSTKNRADVRGSIGSPMRRVNFGATANGEMATKPHPVDSVKNLGELKALAKQHGVKGYSKYKKADIEALRDLVREAIR